MGNSSSSFDYSDLEKLEISVSPNLSRDDIHLTDDGTLFYFHPDNRLEATSMSKSNPHHYASFQNRQSQSPSRLYVKSQESEISTELPPGEVYLLRAFGNAIYICAEFAKKIYMAEFIPPAKINVSYIRDLFPGEILYSNGLCTRVQYGNKHVYRMCDDPVKDAILVDIPDDVFRNSKVICIHRDKVIFVPINFKGNRASIIKLKDNAIMMELPFNITSALAQESSSFVYITCNPPTKMFSFSHLTSMLCTLDTKKMELLPALHIGEFVACNFLGIDDGVISFWSRTDIFGGFSVISAKLPNTHFTNSDYSMDFPAVERSISNEYASKMTSEFEIIKVLGVGGFGVVFETNNKFDHCKYAIKRIAINARHEELALKEVRTMAKLEHPGIVRYNSTWIERPPEGWQPNEDVNIRQRLDKSSQNLFVMNYRFDSVFIYIQMQLCKYSLAGWLADNNEASKRPLIRMKVWFKQIVSAVSYIHEMNLIHRDLKPANILFVDDDHLKICDLGIATQRKPEGVEETNLTRTSIGTEMYMSPEQRSIASKYSSKTDVFTLGLILAEMCIVMASDDRTNIFDNYRKGTPNDLFEDAETADFVLMLTQVDPKNRPTCLEILDHQYLASL